MTPGEVGSGMVTGGWEFVAASYGVCWLMLVGYAVSLWLRASHGGEE